MNDLPAPPSPRPVERDQSVTRPEESRGEPAGFAGGGPSREGMGTLPGFPYQRKVVGVKYAPTGPTIDCDSAPWCSGKAKLWWWTTGAAEPWPR